MYYKRQQAWFARTRPLEHARGTRRPRPSRLDSLDGRGRPDAAAGLHQVAPSAFQAYPMLPRFFSCVLNHIVWVRRPPDDGNTSD